MVISSMTLRASVVLVCFVSLTPASGRYSEQVPDRWSSQSPDYRSNNAETASKLAGYWSDYQIKDLWDSTKIPKQTFQRHAVAYTWDSSATTQAAEDGSEGAGRKVWCIGKPSAQDIYLIRNLQYACGEGGVDCTQIQPGGSCFRQNSLVALASYAMNMFYQKNGRNWWTCHFNNTGLLVFTDPSFGNCIYPPQWMDG